MRSTKFFMPWLCNFLQINLNCSLILYHNTNAKKNKFKKICIFKFVFIKVELKKYLIKYLQKLNLKSRKYKPEKKAYLMIIYKTHRKIRSTIYIPMRT